MFITFFGTPSDLTVAATRLMRALLQVSVGEHRWIGVSTAEELAGAWTSINQGSAILFAEIPDARIARLIEEAGAPTLVFLDRPIDVYLSMVLRRGLAWQVALVLPRKAYPRLTQ